MAHEMIEINNSHEIHTWSHILTLEPSKFRIYSGKTIKTPRNIKTPKTSRTQKYTITLNTAKHIKNGYLAI